jgi:DNA-binding XRE family transcriptional regulator
MPEPWAFEVWPAHPAPDPGECLTSYLLRLAEANGGVRVWDLIQDAFPAWTYPQQLSLLSWEYPVDDWGRLPLRAQRSPTELAALTVVSWVAKFRPLPVVDHPGNRSPASALRGAIAPTLRVCPRCLVVAPSVPLLWRLTPVVACVEHGCWLQTQCPACAQALAVIGPAQRPGRCAHCGADLRRAPVVPADAELLAHQRRRQTALRFLLDPVVTLVPPVAPGHTTPAATLPQAIGAKLRTLREQGGWSVAALAARLAVSPQTIGELERGRRTSLLPLYLAYLEALEGSWPTLADLALPVAFLQPGRRPTQWELRRCPTPTCSQHTAPSATGVTRTSNLPDRQVARFRCKACGRRFTRSYDGTLRQKLRRPSIQPGDPPPVVKPGEQIAQLVAAGRRGLPNRHIARQLGWGQRTVREYWIALCLEEEVHRAQAHRRAQDVQQRRSHLRQQVEAILAALQQTDGVITLQLVGRALGRNRDYLQTVPELATLVREVAQQHNTALRQRREAEFEARVMGALEAVRGAAARPSMGAVAQLTGLDCDRLQIAHPMLHDRVRQAVHAERVVRRTALRQRQIIQIHAAARRLVDQGSRLTYTGLLAAAKVNRYYGFRDPLIHDVLEQWIGDSMPCD